MANPPIRIVDWYRADPWPRMRRALSVGPTILTIGGIVVAASFLTRQSVDVRVAAAILGLACVASGAMFTTVGMYRILRDEAFLAVRTDGITLGAKGVETLVPWADLEGVRWDAEGGAIVLERSGAEALLVTIVFANVGGPDLARRLQQQKRRADLNMLR